MTATTATASAATAGKPGFSRLMLAEWTKLRSVRSTVWSLLLLVVLDLGFTVLPMLAAKALVFGLLALVLGTAVCFAAFFVGAAILHSKVAVSLGDPGVLRAVVGGGLYLAMLGLFALAVGAILRQVAAGITGVIGVVLVLAPLAQLLPGSISKHVHAYLPSEAGHLITQAHQAQSDLLTPWQGYEVFCLWTALLLLVAAILLQRRDA